MVYLVQSSNSVAATPLRFLVIGDQAMPVADADISVVAFADLSVQLLQQIRPDVVVAPLLAGQIDALDVAALLYACAYDGRLCILARALPDPDLIRADIARIAPDLAVDLLVVS